ncbi:MAG: asparagine synthase (glutamine-hydrolyzing) [Nitrospirales bacterium]
MCGIAGFLDHSPNGIPYNLSEVATHMAETMYFRGPDHGGVWTDQRNGLALSHRRLAVIDLSPSGYQPMLSADKRYVIVYNGEIYNFLELKKTLGDMGHTFSGTSDTEVLLKSCEIWGVKKAIEQCIGMFAFGLWDREKKTLTLGRDRLGIKPLYWANFENAFIFGSELKALRAHPRFSPSLDLSAMATYLRFGYIPSPNSIYEYVHKLEPGCLLTFRPTRPPLIERYWDLRKIAIRNTRKPWRFDEQETLSQFENVLGEAVRQRLIADVPLGAFLSGGIDSSTVVALMQKYSDQPVRTFTIGFQETAKDESVHAKKIAAHLGTNHQEFIIEPHHIFHILPRLADWYDEPFSDISQIPTFFVSKMTRQEVTVALSGDGGDELFAGYRRYFKLSQRLHQLGKVPPVLRPILSSVAGIPPLLLNSSLAYLPPKLIKLTKKLRTLSQTFGSNGIEDQYLQLISRWENPLELVPDATKESVNFYSDQTLAEDFPDPITRMQYCEMMTLLPDDILAKVDRASMAVSLEVRVPILDHRVVEFAWSLPGHMKIRNGQSKWLLRQLLHKYAPVDLFERPKMGFGIPIGKWLRGPLREWAEDLLSENALKKSGLFNPVPIRKRWQEHLSGTHDRTRSLWTILMFQTWHDRWM